MSDALNLVELHNVTFGYGERVVLRDLSLTVPRGKVTALMGASGGGKTTVLRPITEELRKLVDEAAPDARSSIKWGMPFYTLGEAMLCAIGAHKGHVNLILSGPAETFDDPHGRLTGEGKTGRHLKLISLAELPREEVRGWLKSAVARARAA